MFFPGTGVVGRLCRGPTWEAGVRGPGLGLALSEGCCALGGLQPSLGWWERPLPGAVGGLPGGHTSPLSYRRRITDALSLLPGWPSRGWLLRGGVGRPLSHPCPAPSLVWWAGLSNGSPRLPPMGPASLCEVPPGQAPACLEALYPPLCSPHCLPCWSSAQPERVPVPRVLSATLGPSTLTSPLA